MADRNFKNAFKGAQKLDRNGLGGPLILQLQRQGRVNDHQVADGGSPRINFVGPQSVSKVSNFEFKIKCQRGNERFVDSRIILY